MQRSPRFHYVLTRNHPDNNFISILRSLGFLQHPVLEGKALSGSAPGGGIFPGKPAFEYGIFAISYQHAMGSYGYSRARCASSDNLYPLAGEAAHHPLP